jgi:hypothetical protein
MQENCGSPVLSLLGFGGSNDRRQTAIEVILGYRSTGNTDPRRDLFLPSVPPHQNEVAQPTKPPCNEKILAQSFAAKANLARVHIGFERSVGAAI